MSNTYKLGTSVKVMASFFDDDGIAFDPGTVTAMIKEPGGTETSYVYGTDIEVVKTAYGVYHLWVETVAAGMWAYRWKGDDTVDVANESVFDVDASEFATP